MRDFYELIFALNKFQGVSCPVVFPFEVLSKPSLKTLYW
ncbi:hypothetical protein ADIARSV_1880 [Arcticibacter svalbardensis MN12-7]|uniref:Uncharacterized protein n=1 Tax=Arcticibacter svalbardensis MN12-7 TaxID=1150600 RepID=R9H103_9SPHI|nr:hypothetical protein ADIARSV_1880 [Arcticibacter svalbardensis MN12-7]